MSSNPPGDIPPLPTTPTLREAQTLAAMAGLPALEARMLLSHVTGLTRTQLITRDQDHLNEAQRDAFSTLLARRLTGEPMAYLLG
ncbi:MAG: peptide chain release factor N(5)-glutamine methyltransferase, partial [Cupriavidus sp.]|nr:peptide chain release factor N(5)-glutamine methyltransferase [Cupriavidus sp.]